MNWPRAGGHDVHGSQMMRGLAERGHEIWLATDHLSPREAVDGLGIAQEIVLSHVPLADPGSLIPATRWQQRFEEYWGQDPARRLALATLTRQQKFDAVIALGTDAPLLFRGVRSGQCIWYAADDSALHHWSRINLFHPESWRHLRTSCIHAFYEWAFASRIDRVWVVSAADKLAMRTWTGCPVDIVANGVDADYFQPPKWGETPFPNHLAFWGRLDFGPNEEALSWFMRHVWPRVRQGFPAAQFDVFGFLPTQKITKLCQSTAGVRLYPNLPDLRSEISGRAIAVLPFISGRGIKNKLLEAAAMGRAIACTPQALTGTLGHPPVLRERSPSRLAMGIVDLLHNPLRCGELGQQAREWVTKFHTWDTAAAKAEESLCASHTHCSTIRIPARNAQGVSA
ncbi:MAG: glycosyltransferase [Bacteroidales bacterium]|nr:glycosyltransferase [Bacteroidales bacterium]